MVRSPSGKRVSGKKSPVGSIPTISANIYKGEAVADLEILNFDINGGNAPSLKEGLEHLRETVEQKLALVHEGTTVHTDYLICLQELDKLIDMCEGD